MLTLTPMIFMPFYNLKRIQLTKHTYIWDMASFIGEKQISDSKNKK